MLHKPTVTDADLIRLKDERDRADRLYNEALTALDGALTKSKALPVGGLDPDTAQLERLNRLWQIVPPEPVPFSGWRARLGTFVWRLVGPMLQRQQELNAALVEHANRTAARDRESAESLSALTAALGDELRALAHMQARLIAYLQHVTLYVDTKDRYEAGLLWHELRGRTEGLAAGLSALGDELLKRREHMLSRDQRDESTLAEIRTRVAEIDRAVRAGASKVVTAGAARPSDLEQRGQEVVTRTQLAGEADSSTYAGFEDLYRGSNEEIKDRLAEYVPLFSSAGVPVLDLGCGRGEFLLALREQGIAGRGVDINASMVERCRALGLDVVQGEALAFLSGLRDETVGGILAAQVVEHLEPDRLLQLIDLCRAKLRPGGRLVLETVNPACWAAFFSSYIRDITHVRPVHPDTLRYLLIARGFEHVDVRYSSPYPLEAKLHPLPLTLTSGGPALTTVVHEFNRNVEILNGQLFTHLDYAAIGQKA